MADERAASETGPYGFGRRRKGGLCARRRLLYALVDDELPGLEDEDGGDNARYGGSEEDPAQAMAGGEIGAARTLRC
jgi:hypothetical protein